MTTLNVEGWCRSANGEAAMPLEQVRFHISEACHRALEAAEEELQRTHATEKFVEVSPRELRLEMPSGCGPLVDCKLRVYLGGMDNERGQFHLVGQRLNDGSLVYTNPVMVDVLLS
jgi:hypothetical protein